MKTKLHTTLAALAAILATHASLLAQGSLTPPGAPGPTMKTLDQIDAKLEKRTPISSLPFVISQPGSYYLTQNLAMVGGGTGITINASNVTIDLNGFQLDGGNAGSTGIGSPGSHTRWAVRNGTLTNWSVLAIHFGDSSIVEDLRIEGPDSGILVGNNSVVRRCIVRATASGSGAATGIAAFALAVIADCSVFSDRPDCEGISVNIGATIRNCTVMGYGRSAAGIRLFSGSVESVTVRGYDFGIRHAIANRGVTIHRATVQDCNTGIFLINDAVVADCVVNAPDFTAAGTGPAIEGSDRITVTNSVTYRHSTGIKLGMKGRVAGCTTEGQTTAGIEVGADSAVSQSHSHGNGASGIVAGDRAVLTGCQANQNAAHGIVAGATASINQCQAAQNSFAGISAGTSALVIDCQTTSNTEDGIQVSHGARVSNCTSRNNSDDGIQITGGAHISGCTSDGNGWGIFGTASYSRIEGNNVISNSNTGLRLDAGGNTVFRNSFSGNPVAINAPGNDVAPLQNAATMTNPAANIAF